MSGNVVSQGHYGPRSRISREWDREGRGGTQSGWHLWSQSCRTRPRTKAPLSMSQSPIAKAGWGWVVGSPIFPMEKMRLREGRALAGDHNLSQWCSRLQNPRALLPGPEALTCLLRVGCRKSSPTGLGWGPQGWGGCRLAVRGHPLTMPGLPGDPSGVLSSLRE